MGQGAWGEAGGWGRKWHPGCPGEVDVRDVSPRPPVPPTIPWICQGVADVAKHRGPGGEVARDRGFQTNTG